MNHGGQLALWRCRGGEGASSAGGGTDENSPLDRRYSSIAAAVEAVTTNGGACLASQCGLRRMESLDRNLPAWGWGAGAEQLVAANRAGALWQRPSKRRALTGNRRMAKYYCMIWCCCAMIWCLLLCAFLDCETTYLFLRICISFLWCDSRRDGTATCAWDALNQPGSARLRV